MEGLKIKIMKQLEFAIRRDAEKGGAGFRTTREVADYAGVKLVTARRALNRLVAECRIECFDGSPLSWRLANKEMSHGA